MADTASITVGKAAWVQVGAATQQVVVTPIKPGFTFLIRYASTQPAAGVNTGHKFFAQGDIPNAILGGANGDAIWMRLLKGEDQEVLVSII